MVWYIPPLSPLLQTGDWQSEVELLDHMIIPLQYLANLLPAGNITPVRLALQRLMALRRYMRSVRVEHSPNIQALEDAGLTETLALEMYHLLAIAEYRDRFVVPTVRNEEVGDLYAGSGELGFPPGSIG
jgi:nitrate reductase beta subunit